MKAVIKKTKEIEFKPEYPCLKISKSGNVVLFTEHKMGFRVATDSDYQLGDHSTNWDMAEFTPFTGTIELSND